MSDLPDRTRAAFVAFPDAVRAGLLALRALIMEVAREDGITLREELRWGQPAYLAPKGTTIRLGVPKGAGFALFVHCQTSLIEDFRAGPGAGMRFEGRCAVPFDTIDEIDAEALTLLIRRALTWRTGGKGRS